MNKRIDQLMIKAGAYFGGDGVVYDTFDPKKFAELIIQECGTVINSENYREHSKGWNDAIEWADGMIKEHFGVEE
jgi:hypothetical protein